MARLSRDNKDRHLTSKKSFDWIKVLLVLNILLTVSLIYLHLR
jgi:hypothetical protein